MQSTEALVFRLREEEGVVLVLVCGHGGCGGYRVTSLKALRLLSQKAYWAKAEVMAIWQSLKWDHWYIGLSYDTHTHACIHTPNEQFLPWTLVRYFLTKRNKKETEEHDGIKKTDSMSVYSSLCLPSIHTQIQIHSDRPANNQKWCVPALWQILMMTSLPRRCVRPTPSSAVRLP